MLSVYRHLFQSAAFVSWICMVAREAGSLLWKLVGWVSQCGGGAGLEEDGLRVNACIRYLESVLSNVHNVGMRSAEPGGGGGRLGI